MKKPTRFWLALSSMVSLLMVVSCSNDDNSVNVPVHKAVETGLNQALTTTVVPLVDFMGLVGTLLSSGARAVAVDACPDTSGWCATGTASCSVGVSGLDFEFDQCQALGGDTPLTLSGSVTAIPGTTVALTLTDLVINGSPAVSGTGTIDVLACNYSVDVSTSDAMIAGTVIVCDSDPYPTGQSMVISFSDFIVTIAFNGSSTAQATATQGGSGVALCTIDLDSDPLSSSCDSL